MVALARELFAYMGARKKWWLLPLIAALVATGASDDLSPLLSSCFARSQQRLPETLSEALRSASTSALASTS